MPRLNFTLVLHNESGAYQTCSYVCMNRVSVNEGKSPLSISGEHEFKWYLQMDLL